MASFADLALPMPMAASAADATTDQTLVTDSHVAQNSDSSRDAEQGVAPHAIQDRRPQQGPRPAGAPPRKRRWIPESELPPLSEVMLRRLTTIKEGDNVLLRLPSDQVKAVVATKEG